MLLATTGLPQPAMAANFRLKGTAGSGQAEEKYLSGLELKKLQAARRKEALTKRCCPCACASFSHLANLRWTRLNQHWALQNHCSWRLQQVVASQ